MLVLAVALAAGRGGGVGTVGFLGTAGASATLLAGTEAATNWRAGTVAFPGAASLGGGGRTALRAGTFALALPGGGSLEPAGAMPS